MPINQYNYGVTLIRRTYDSYVIDPSEDSPQSLFQKLLSEHPGNNFLATRTQGELSYYIFLSEDTILSHICGWIITLNGCEEVSLVTHPTD